MDIVKFMIDNGTDVTPDNSYALRHTDGRDHLDVIKILIDNGADVTVDNIIALTNDLRWQIGDDFHDQLAEVFMLTHHI